MVLLAHYKFNEAPAQNATTAVDVAAGGSGSHSGTYTFSSPDNNGGLEPGGIGGRHTRISLNDSGSVASLGNISDLRITGEMTVMFWYYSEDTDSWHPIVEVNGVDETQAENKLFSVSRESSGRLAMKWEYSTGIDIDVFSANNIVQDLDKWMHCAIVRKLNGSNFNVLFYVNGVLVDTQDNGGGGYTAPDGGGNSLGFIGRDQASTEPVGTYRIDSLRVYNTAESSASISSQYSAEVDSFESYAVNIEENRRIITPNGLGYISFLLGERNSRGYGGFR